LEINRNKSESISWQINARGFISGTEQERKNKDRKILKAKRGN
jgi:hypothetical protein